MRTEQIYSALRHEVFLLRFALVFTGLLTAPLLGWAQHAGPAGDRAAPMVGNPAISFELKTLEGKSVGLAAFRGKPLIINFFATWCDPCREEMPLINELAGRSLKDGYSVLGVAVEDTRAAVAEYVREAKLIFPVALDFNSTVKRSYRIFGPPATFFIDHQGTIRDIVLGPMTGERAREALRKTGIAAEP
ncbi:MAG TPA: TlpA disulfide reductase family protein [Candidatus Binatia bacterium]|nr:TlpA disulfide reductase family protein [Candidatus Binatia bacterium]